MNEKIYGLAFLLALVGALAYAFYALHTGRADLSGTAFAAALGMLARPPGQGPAPKVAVPLLLAGLLGLGACVTLLSQGTEAMELHHRAALLQDELLAQAERAIGADLGVVDRAAAADRYTVLVPCLDGAAHAHQLLLRAQEARGKAARDRQLEGHAQAALQQARAICAAGMAQAQALRDHCDLKPANADLGVPRG